MFHIEPHIISYTETRYLNLKNVHSCFSSSDSFRWFSIQHCQVSCYDKSSDFKSQFNKYLVTINSLTLKLLLEISHFYSAGIGRTGTFIALDALYKEGERTGDVDVPKYVETMRNSRMNMIQGEVSRDHWRYINMNDLIIVYLLWCIFIEKAFISNEDDYGKV